MGIQFFSEIIQVDGTSVVGLEINNPIRVAGHSGCGKIGSMRRFWDEYDIPVMIAVMSMISLKQL